MIDENPRIFKKFPKKKGIHKVKEKDREVSQALIGDGFHLLEN